MHRLRGFCVFLFLIGVWLLGVGSAVAQAAPGIPVAGQVLDERGRPLAGASISLAPEPDEHEAARIVLAGGSRPAAVARATSGDGGWFTVEAPEAGLWRVTVEASGFVSMRTTLLPLLDVEVLSAVRLAKAEVHSVRVEDPDGQPVAGAQVWGLSRDPRWRGARREAWRTTGRFTFTDPKGLAVLLRAAGEALELHAFAPGFVESDAVMAGQRTSNVTLRRGVSFDVRFEDPRGRPLVGAAVRVGEGGSPVELLGDDGLVTFTGLPATPLAFEVSTDAGQREDGTLTIEADGSGEVEVMRLPAPIVVHGQVVEAESRAPIARALVWNPRDARHAVRTDRHGAYRMVLREVSELNLQAAATGYVQGRTSLRAQGPGRTDAPTVVLDPATVLLGRVIDSEGNPIAGAAVWPFPRGRNDVVRSWSAGEQARTVSLPDGRFYMAQLPTDVAWDVVARAPGFAESSVAALDRQPTEVVLELPVQVSGTAVGPSEAPIAGAEILLLQRPPDNDPQTLYLMAHRYPFDDRESLPRATSGEDGRFLIDGVTPGTHILIAKGEGLTPKVVDRIDVAEMPRVTDVGIVRLEPAAILEGVVVDRQDRPVPSARVSWYSELPDIAVMLNLSSVVHPEGRSVTTDEAGRFQLPAADGSRIGLSVAAKGFADGRKQGVRVPREEPVRIVLEAGATLAGVVVDGRGEPVARARIVIGRNQGQGGFGFSSRGYSGSDGTFELTDVKAGELVLQANAGGHVSGVLEGIKLAPGDRRDDLRLVLDDAVIVAGQVTDPEGRPVVGAYVFAHNPESSGAGPQSFGFGMASSSASTDGDGRFRLVFAQPATVELTVRHERFLKLDRMVELGLGEQRLDLRLDAGRSIGGVVVSADDQPVRAADVTVEPLGVVGFSSRTTHTGDDGGFLLEGLPAGSFRLRAAKDGLAGARSAPIHLDDNDIVGVELRLETGTTLVGLLRGLDREDWSNVTIDATRLSAGERRIGESDRQGGYRLTNLLPGTWWITARVAGTSGQVAREQVDIPDGIETVELDLEFGRGFTITGVLTINGEPVGGVHISASGDGARTVGAETAGDGSFRLEGVPSGRVVIAFTASEHRLYEQRLIDVRSDLEIPFDIRTTRVSGRVVDASGQAIAGANVSMRTLGEAAGGGSGSAVSEADGGFSIVSGRGGLHELWVMVNGFGMIRRELELASGAALSGIEIVLEPSDTLALAVRMVDGTVPRRIEVRALDGAGTMVHTAWSLLTDGVARVAVSLDGTTSLAVTAPGASWVKIPAAALVTGDAAPYAVVLSMGSTLEVRVPSLVGGQQSATVTVRAAGGESLMPPGYGNPSGSLTLHRGRISIQGLPRQVWIVDVVADSGQIWQTQIDATIGAYHEAVLE